jgi:hypothetical protein
MRQGKYITNETRQAMGRRRVVWSLLRKYFDDLKQRFTPDSHELVEKVEQPTIPREKI